MSNGDKSSRFPYAEHDNGIVLTQEADGFHKRPMTPAELAAREPALAIAKDIYRHANQAGVCYYEFWLLISKAIESVRPSLVATGDHGLADAWSEARAIDLTANKDAASMVRVGDMMAATLRLMAKENGEMFAKLDAAQPSPLAAPSDPVAITVSFKANIRPDGDLTRVTITQGDTELQLTKEQAKSLQQQLAGKVQP
jgi:hypothetical protein